ncbi:MAG TPA: hypothetical protein VFA11_01935 [Acidimicrobiales bacterium]|nr:hypothetical protein [Acidimicrobiales bacterium]
MSVEPAERVGANPAAVIYGVLVVATVVAAESTRRETFAKVLSASVVTLLLYWVAHAYAHHLGGRLRRPARWSGSEAVQVLSHESYILAGAALPLLALAGAWAAGATLETGVTVVLWTSAIELVALELTAGLFLHLRLAELVTEVLVGAGLGVGILAVRVLLH